MGTNNRARRAAKVRDRQRRASGRDAGRRPGDSSGDEPWISDEALIDGLLDLGPARLAAGDRQFAERAVARLLQCPRQLVGRRVEAELTRVVTRRFTEGWQPAELMRQARRGGGPAHAALVATAIVAHHDRSATEPADPRWQRQVDAAAAIAVGSAAGWFAGWCERSALGPTAELMETFAVLATVRSLPPIEQLLPAPGSRRVGGFDLADTSVSDADRRLLERVRHLLDKAESTVFDAEAEAFTAKAHELITRHAIDTALLASVAGPSDEQPIVRRVEIDDPYADAKSLLLQLVAGANRCRTVYHTQLAFSTVLGFPADLAATELLYTSLLVQAQTALAAAGRSAPPGARARSRSYRSAFLVAYANRIGERLEQVNEHVVANAANGGAALPVLRSREVAVDDAVAARFPEMVSSTVRGGHDSAGWVGGRLAADRAQLNLGSLPDGDVGDVGSGEGTAPARG